MKPDIFSYSSYSTYLSDWHNQKTTRDKNWSLGRFSQLSGLSNTAAITNIIKGRKIPSQQTLDKVSEVVGLNQREKMYLETLVELKRNSGNNVIETSLSRLIGFVKPKLSQRELSKNSFSLIAKPIFFILREMVKLSNFESNAGTIKNKLHVSYSEEEIRKAFETLVEVGLLKNEDGILSQSVDFYETTTNIPSEDIKNYHKECLQQSINLIDIVPVEQRHLSSDTLVMNLQDLERLKNVIESFRKEVTTQYDLTEGEVVYQFNCQLLPVTKV